MTITPQITEVHERNYKITLTPQDVADLIWQACRDATGIEKLPSNAKAALLGGPLGNVNVEFTVKLDAASEPSGACAAPSAPQPAASEPISAPETPEKPKAAPAARTAPVRAPSKSARPMAWAGLTPQERSIVLHLEALPDTFSPVDDLNIAQCLTGGVKATEIAPEMGVTPEEVVARWKAMWCSAVLEGKRTPTIAGQERLIAALKYRVETEE